MSSTDTPTDDRSTDSTDQSAEMLNGWTYMKLEQDPDLHQYVLEDCIPDRFTEISNLHISVLPGFKAPADEMEDLLADLAGILPAEQPIDIEGWHCHHPIDSDEETYAIALNVDADLEELRAEQQRLVEEAGGELLSDPVTPHITLFKAGDSEGDGLTPEEEPRVQERLDTIYGLANFADYTGTLDKLVATTF